MTVLVLDCSRKYGLCEIISICRIRLINTVFVFFFHTLLFFVSFVFVWIFYFLENFFHKINSNKKKINVKWPSLYWNFKKKKQNDTEGELCYKWNKLLINWWRFSGMNTYENLFFFEYPSIILWTKWNLYSNEREKYIRKHITPKTKQKRKNNDLRNTDDVFRIYGEYLIRTSNSKNIHTPNTISESMSTCFLSQCFYRHLVHSLSICEY